MPRALTPNFCPQCGCAEVVSRSVEMNTPQFVFSCGEAIKSHGGRLATSYTCRTVPDLMALYEELIFYSTKSVPHLRLPKTASRMLANICKAPAPVQMTNGTQMGLARQLANLGFLCQPDPNRPDVYEPTAWGRHVERILLEGKNQ